MLGNSFQLVAMFVVWCRCHHQMWCDTSTRKRITSLKKQKEYFLTFLQLFVAMQVVLVVQLWCTCAQEFCLPPQYGEGEKNFVCTAESIENDIWKKKSAALCPSRNNALGNFFDCFFFRKQFPIKTVHSKVCGLSWATRTLILQK